MFLVKDFLSLRDFAWMVPDSFTLQKRPREPRALPRSPSLSVVDEGLEPVS